jgi:hypothetical protein
VILSVAVAAIVVCSLFAGAAQVPALVRLNGRSGTPMAFPAMTITIAACLISGTSFRPNVIIVQLVILVALLFAALGLLHVGHTSNSDGFIKRPIVVFFPAFLSLIVLVLNAGFNYELPIFQLFGRFISLVALVFIGCIVRFGDLNLERVLRTFVLAYFTLIASSLLADEVWRSCDVFKCGVFGAIFQGPFQSENLLGQLTVVAIALLLYLPGRFSRVGGLACCLLILVATESRTSQIAAAALCLVYFGLWTVERLSRGASGSAQGLHARAVDWQRLLRFCVTGVLLLSITGTGLYLLWNSDYTDFSNRGGTWIRGIAALEGSFVFGLGIDRWAVLQDYGLVPQLYPHSEYLLMLFSAGAVGVLLLFFFLVVASWRLSASDSGLYVFGSSYILLFSVFGLTEVTWNPVTLDVGLVMILPLILVLGESAAGQRGTVSQSIASVKG